MVTRLRNFTSTLVILALALTATGFTAWSASREAERDARRRFVAMADDLRDAIGDTMRAYAQALRGGAGLVAATRMPTREQWSQFAAALALEREFPGIQGLGFAVVLKPDEISAHEAEQRSRGRPGYTVHPAGERDIYTAIVYLEPDTWRNRRAIGFDMFSEPVRREAMERALASGEPSLSGGVILAQETQTEVQAGTLMYLPVFDPTRLATDRLHAATGFVYAAFRMDDLISRSLARNAPLAAERLSLTVNDGPTSDAQTVLYRSPFARRAAPTDERRARHAVDLNLQVGGRIWRLSFSSTPSLERELASTAPVTLAIAGSIISLLIAGIAGTVALAHRRSLEAGRLLAGEVAARRKAEGEVNVANRELIHRAKNTIAIISAIASQTVRHSTSLDDFRRDFQARLGALARVHDFLRPDQARATDLETLVREVLRPYAGVDAGRLSTSGPVVPLPQNEALVMSLILNEMATNATKYGAWSRPEGKVRLDWAREEADGMPRLAVSWVEAGGPPVVEPTRVGFGSNVLKFVVERSLGGRLETSFDAEGVAHRFWLPWPRPADAGLRQ